MKLASTVELPNPQPRKIIYSGQVTLDCENLEKTTDKLLATVKQMGGYLGDGNSSGAKGSVRESTWTVRIPVERYDELMKAISGMGELKESSQKAQDVSEEFYDAQARLKNLNIEEQRMIDLLKNRSAGLSEVLTVEKEITRVREESERIEGRIRYLAHQSDLSTVTITLREVKKFVPVSSPSLGTRTGRAFHDSLASMRDLGESAVIGVVTVVPWALPFVVLALILLKVTKRPQRQASIQSPDPS